MPKIPTCSMTVPLKNPQLDSEEVEACDENPFGVEVSITATLGPILEQLSAIG